MHLDSIYVYQVAYYFISHFDYKVIDVKGLDNELWICNKNHRTYPIIRISCNSSNETETIKNRTDHLHTQIMNSLNCHEQMLDIHISDEQCDDPHTIFMSIGHYSGTDVSLYYPDLTRCMHKVENPEKEFMDIVGKFKALKKPKSSFKQIIMQKPFVTYTFLAICSIIFALSFYLRQLNTNTSENAIVLGAYYKIFISMGQWWRLFTYGFVHTEIMHFICNMFALWNLGNLLEKYYGHVQYALTLILGIIFGGLFMYATTGNTVCLGLSGGLYALLGALAVYLIQTKLYKVKSVRNSIMMTVLLNLMINFLPGIGVWTHVGGFIAGFAITFMLTKNKAYHQLRKNILACFVILIAALCMKCQMNRQIDKLYTATDIKVVQMYDSLGLKGLANSSYEQLVKFYGEMK